MLVYVYRDIKLIMMKKLSQYSQHRITATDVLIWVRIWKSMKKWTTNSKG